MGIGKKKVYGLELEGNDRGLLGREDDEKSCLERHAPTEERKEPVYIYIYSLMDKVYTMHC